jgi:predicted acylesterase/phospholipase RssA
MKSIKSNKNLKKKKQYEKTILVLSGGSIMGIGHIGVIKAFEENDMMKKIKTIVATSSGGIVGLLIACGYKSHELLEFIKILRFEKLHLSNTDQMFSSFGLDDGNKIMLILEKLLDNKHISKFITFSEFYKLTGIDLVLTGVCVNTKKVEYFSYKSYSDMPVLIAIRITFSIPFVFSPVIYKKNTYIDGGIMDNYPIHYVKTKLKNVIGVCLCSIRDQEENFNSIEKFFWNVFQCGMEGITQIAMRNYETNTIIVSLKSSALNITNTNNDEKNLYYETGYNVAKEFIEKNTIKIV